jgi:diguanylate cyclase (GGDEF)-like protein
MRADRLARLQGLFADAPLDRGRAHLHQTAAQEIAQSLEFARVIIFARDGAQLSPQAVYDEDDPQPRIEDYVDRPQPNVLEEIVRGSECIEGTAEDLTAPLYDVRHWYACAPINCGATRGAIYADGPREGTQGPWTVLTLQRAAAILGILLESARLLEAEKARAERAQEEAVRDPLTRLLNRRGLHERMQEEISRRNRDGGSFGFVILDVDDFKRVNDTFGHDAGDEYLQHIATALHAAVRREDIVARIGGDEFGLLLPGADAKTCQAIVTRVYAELLANKLPCSIGIAVFPQCGATEAEIIKRADEAAYAAKSAGKNRFVFHPAA